MRTLSKKYFWHGGATAPRGQAVKDATRWWNPHRYHNNKRGAWETIIAAHQYHRQIAKLIERAEGIWFKEIELFDKEKDAEKRKKIKRFYKKMNDFKSSNQAQDD